MSEKLMNIKTLTKTLLYSYNTSTYQRAFSVTIPDNCKYAMICHHGYSGKTDEYRVIMDTSIESLYACLSTWGPRNGFPFRGRNASFSPSTMTLSFGTGYRYDPSGDPVGWYYDDRICPVYEIYGLN